MFGLMRAKKCGMTETEKHFRRLNYCGTCKTIGSLYGQKARFLLNHDTVFLAEFLSALSGENVQNWQKSYQSFNCLNLPESEMPVPLKFAATTNVILTEFKLADHIADEGKRRYKFAQKAFSKEFQKAEDLMKSWDFALDDVKAILASQKLRESEIKADTFAEILEALAAPTAQTTATFFREGVKQIRRNELQDSAYSLGFSFGKMVYLLDAFEDYEKDFRRRQFNAFRAAFGLNDAKLSVEMKRKIITILGEIEAEIIEKLVQIPINENQKNLFISRLSQNLQRKLKTALPILEAKKSCVPKIRRTRWQNASEKARNLARKNGWQMPLVFLFVFVFALVAPAQTREAKSARECFDLSFNLMFLGAIFGAVLSAPKVLLYDEKKEERRNKWCEWWCCDCTCCDCGCCCDDCSCCGDDCCCDCSCD